MHVMRPMRRVGLWGIVTIASACILYVSIAAGLLLFPANADYTPPESGIPVYVTTNGFHTDIVVPLTSDAYSWWQRLDTVRFARFRKHQFLAMGWGDQGFYEASYPGREITASVVLGALFLPSASQLHLTFYQWPLLAGKDVVLLHLTSTQYQLLVQRMLESAVVQQGFRLGADAILGYADNGFFVPAAGSYHVFHTCNCWTGETLRAAGLPLPAWTPFEWGVLQPLNKLK